MRTFLPPCFSRIGDAFFGLLDVTPPSGTSGRRRRGAATAHTRSTTSSPTGNAPAGREHRPHRLRQRGGRERLGERLDRVGELGRAGRPCRRGTAARGTARWPPRGSPPPAACPASSIPMPANATVPDQEQEHDGGDQAAGGVPAQRDAGERRSRSPGRSSSTSTLSVLAREQPGARQRRRAEALQHAVAAFVAGGDPEAHHRARHHRQREHAGHQEVDRVLVASCSPRRPTRRTRGCRAGSPASPAGSRRAAT